MAREGRESVQCYLVSRETPLSGHAVLYLVYTGTGIQAGNIGRKYMQLGNTDRKYRQVIQTGNTGRKYRQVIQTGNTGREYR